MRPLSALDLIGIWERGDPLPPCDRALAILATALPDESPEALAGLSLGRRDSLLLSLRAATLGDRIEGVSPCPGCGEWLEFAIRVSDIRAPGADAPEPEHAVQFEGFDLRFRLLNSRDLAAAAACPDVALARRLLIQRCVRHASKEDVHVPAAELPSPVVEMLAAHLAECDPQAEVLLHLSCPVCGNAWQASFDIAGYFWTEIDAYATRLLGEVALLARAYGWGEREILSMGARRRQFYLERAFA
jgi:hypothetical protein